MPALSAKPISLTVRPFQVANLCFEVGGILGESFMELGSKVPAFDFSVTYKDFRLANTNAPRDDGRVPFDSDGIDFRTKPNTVIHPPDAPPPPALAALRAETVKAALNKAINARANAFITKYGNAANIISVLKQVKPSKGNRLGSLSSLAEKEANALGLAYAASDHKGVVVATTTHLVSSLTPKGKTKTETTDPLDSEQPRQAATSKSETFFVPVSGSDLASTQEIQDIVNTGYEFRFPSIENLARLDRAQISLSDEAASHFIETHFLDRMHEVFDNELASIDTDVNQLQVAYLNTILLSPIAGIVTGVYKNPGDPVSPGEPVFRVENNDELLIVARVVFRGRISVGSILHVTTTLFDSPGLVETEIKGPIVAARGQGEDDQWEVIAKCKNLGAAGQNIFPLGYNFDYDNTEVSIEEPGDL